MPCTLLTGFPPSIPLTIAPTNHHYLRTWDKLTNIINIGLSEFDHVGIFVTSSFSYRTSVLVVYALQDQRARGERGASRIDGLFVKKGLDNSRSGRSGAGRASRAPTREVDQLVCPRSNGAGDTVWRTPQTLISSPRPASIILTMQPVAILSKNSLSLM